MTNLNDAQIKQADTLKKFRPAIQVWMNENVVDPASPVSAKLIYNALRESCKLTMNEQSFQVLLSLNVKGGFINGFYGKKGIGGGYLPGTKPETEEKTKVDLTLAAAVDLGNGTRLGHDGEKWAITGGASNLYFNSLVRAVNHAQDTVVEEEFKKLHGDLTLADLIDAVKNAGNLVADRIKSVMSDSVVPAPEAPAEDCSECVTGCEVVACAPVAEAPKEKRKARSSRKSVKTEELPAQEATETAE